MFHWVSQIRLYPERFVKTIALWTSILAIGLSFGVIGPTLLDLKTQVSRELGEVSSVLPARAGGYALGSIVMGILYDKINILFFGAISMGFATVLTALLPHMSDLYWLLSLFFLNGCFLGAFEAASSMLLLHIWGKENGPFMQAFHFFFGIGSLVAPLIAQPFLVESDELVETTTLVTDVDSGNTTTVTQLIRSFYDMMTNETTTFSPEAVSSLQVNASDIQLVYPYSFVATILAFNAVFWLILWILRPETTEHPSRERNPPSVVGGNNDDSPVDKDGNMILQTIDSGAGKRTQLSDNVRESTEKSLVFYKGIVITLTMMFMHIYYGLELTFGSFLVTFAVESNLNLSKKDGAQLTSLFWATFTFWRLTTIFYIEYIGNEMNILFALSVILVGNVILVPFANSSVLCLWIGVAFIGLGTSSIWSCVFGYLEEYFPVTSRIASSMIVSAIIGEFIFPLIISNFVADTPQIFLWVTLFCSLSLTIIFLFLVLVMRKKMKELKVSKRETK